MVWFISIPPGKGKELLLIIPEDHSSGCGMITYIYIKYIEQIGNHQFDIY